MLGLSEMLEKAKVPYKCVSLKWLIFINRNVTEMYANSDSVSKVETISCASSGLS